MGCLQVTINKPYDGLTSSLTRVGGMTASAQKVGGLTARAEKIGGLTATAQGVGRMTSRISLVCSVGNGLYMIEIADGTPIITMDNGYLFVEKAYKQE